MALASLVVSSSTRDIHLFPLKGYLDPQTTHKSGISPTMISGVKPIFKKDLFEGSGTYGEGNFQVFPNSKLRSPLSPPRCSKSSGSPWSASAVGRTAEKDGAWTRKKKGRCAEHGPGKKGVHPTVLGQWPMIQGISRVQVDINETRSRTSE